MRKRLCECAVVSAPTNHAVNRAEEHGALCGRGALAQVLQHQRAVAEDIDKLPEVEDPHLLQVLPLLVCGGRTDRRKDGGREIQRGERMEDVGGSGVEAGANKKKSNHIVKTEKKMSK